MSPWPSSGNVLIYFSKVSIVVPCLVLKKYHVGVGPDEEEEACVLDMVDVDLVFVDVVVAV